MPQADELSVMCKVGHFWVEQREEEMDRRVSKAPRYDGKSQCDQRNKKGLSHREDHNLEPAQCRC